MDTSKELLNALDPKYTLKQEQASVRVSPECPDMSKYMLKTDCKAEISKTTTTLKEAQQDITCPPAVCPPTSTSAASASDTSARSAKKGKKFSLTNPFKSKSSESNQGKSMFDKFGQSFGKKKKLLKQTYNTGIKVKLNIEGAVVGVGNSNNWNAARNLAGQAGGELDTRDFTLYYNGKYFIMDGNNRYEVDPDAGTIESNGKKITLTLLPSSGNPKSTSENISELLHSTANNIEQYPNKYTVDGPTQGPERHGNYKPLLDKFGQPSEENVQKRRERKSRKEGKRSFMNRIRGRNANNVSPKGLYGNDEESTQGPERHGNYKSALNTSSKRKFGFKNPLFKHDKKKKGIKTGIKLTVNLPSNAAQTGINAETLSQINMGAANNPFTGGAIRSTHQYDVFYDGKFYIMDDETRYDIDPDSGNILLDGKQVSTSMITPDGSNTKTTSENISNLLKSTAEQMNMNAGPTGPSSHGNNNYKSMFNKFGKEKKSLKHGKSSRSLKKKTWKNKLYNTNLPTMEHMPHGENAIPRHSAASNKANNSTASPLGNAYAAMNANAAKKAKENSPYGPVSHGNNNYKSMFNKFGKEHKSLKHGKSSKHIKKKTWKNRLFSKNLPNIRHMPHGENANLNENATLLRSRLSTQHSN